MRTILFLVLLLAACSSGSVVPNPTPTSTEPDCGSNPMARVYHPERLKILDPCVIVSGTIAAIRTEADGDLHIRLNADDTSLINSVNVRDQHGSLVVEPVCVKPVTQEDAKSACEGYHNPMAIPRVGMRVRMTGPHVLDTAHGWLEIHPLIRWEQIR